MKKIDRLLLTSFIGPFVVSFGIALFILIMQFLWLYIDEIAGKGVSVIVLMELLGYMSISVFPMALPIAVLLASVMVMGNLAERYELSSMKSAGVSLLRVMRPLMVVCAGVALFSFTCYNYLIPISTLKFRTRLFDIRKQKPALSIEKGVFNEDFRSFVIRVGNKKQGGEIIEDVLIEDQTSNNKLKFSQILADSGAMYTTDDKRYFVMQLYRGAEYQEPLSGSLQNSKYPFVRTKFKSWQKVWDMREFEMNSSDPERFKAQRTMLSMEQLRQSIDSLRKVMWTSRMAIVDDILLNPKRKPVKPPPPAIKPVSPQDSIRAKKDAQLSVQLSKAPKAAASSTTASQKKIPRPQILPKHKIPPPTPSPNAALPTPFQRLPDLLEQEINKPISEYKSFLETFPASRHKRLLDEGQRLLKINRSNYESRRAHISSKNLEAVKSEYELYTKYAFSLVCFLFLFIGAPMGALIRKGGFGYPILIAIVYFVLFIFLTIFCRKLAESFVLPPFWAAMMPCLLLTPLAAVLTYRAMNDIPLLSTDRWSEAFRWLVGRLRKKQTVPV